jgi:hypothetical protein
MFISNSWQSKVAVLVALGMASATIVPAIAATPVTAPQSNSTRLLLAQSPQSIVSVGTVIPVRYKKSNRVLVTPKESVGLTLTTATSIRSERGNVVIPAGSQINGRLRPANGGSQFVAESVVIGNQKRKYPIEATSAVVTRKQTINQKTNPDFLRGAVVGAAVGAVASEIFGSLDLGAVLGGAGAGVLGETLLGGRRRKEVEVVVVNPNQDLDLTLEEDFVLSRNR